VDGGSEVMAQLQKLNAQLADMRQQIEALTAVVGELREGRQPHDPLLDARAIWEYLGRGRTWFYDARKVGTIPPPDKGIGGRGGERWHRSSIDRAMRIQANGRSRHG
jgi:predicted DNA-binding transcriptional regulator AlpA